MNYGHPISLTLYKNLWFFSTILIFANVLFFMIFSMYMNFSKRRILGITGDIERNVKISMTIGEVPKVGILNISRDVEQQFTFFMVCGRGGRAEC